MNPLLLMIMGGLVLLGAAAWLYAADRQVRAHSQRISNVSIAYAPTAAAAMDIRRPWAKPVSEATPMSRVLAHLGIDTDRPDIYPMPWWILLFITSVLALAIAAAGNFFIGPVAWISLPADVFLFSYLLFNYFRNRRTAQLYAQLPDALAMTVRSVRVGFTVQDALRIVAEEGQWPTSAEFRRVIDEIRLGGSLQDALVKLAHRSNLLEYRFLAVALALQSQSGGSLSETLENLADVVRKRVALKGRAIALSSEARTTMYVLGALPFVVSGALLVLNPGYLTPLISTPTGKKILFAGFVLLGLGFSSMKYIIKKSVS